MSSSREFYLVRRKWATSSNKACHLKPHGFRLNHRQRQCISTSESIAIDLLIYSVMIHDDVWMGSLLCSFPDVFNLCSYVIDAFVMALSQAKLMRLPMLYEVDVTGIDASAGDEESDCGMWLWVRRVTTQSSWQIRRKTKRLCNLFLLLTCLSTNHESFVFLPRSSVSDSFVQCVWKGHSKANLAMLLLLRWLRVAVTAFQRRLRKE